MTLTLAIDVCKLLKNGGRAGTRTPDLLRVNYAVSPLRADQDCQVVSYYQRLTLAFTLS